MDTESDLIKQLQVTLKAAGLKPEQAADIINGRACSDSTRALALLIFDVDHIQDTLLASPRPVTIYGASDGLRHFDSAVKSDQPGLNAATVVYAGGGNALLLTPLAQTKLAVAALQRLLDEHVPGAQATPEWLAVSPKDLTEGPPELPSELLAKAARLGLQNPEANQGFGALVANLQHRLRLKKSAARAHHFLTGPSKTERCEECAWRPRSQDTRCTACAVLRDSGGKARSATAPEGLQTARNFEELFGVGNRIAYVHIDGRGIGKQMRACRSLLSYRQLSETLHQTFYETPHEQLRTSYKDAARLRFVVITAGGDDLFLVLPATGPTTDVFTFVRSLLQGIEKVKVNDEPLHAGAGIVITKSLAADYCCSRAMALCKDAKDQIAQGSVVNFDFLLAGSPDATEAEASTRMELTQRPYTLTDFSKLVDTARAVSGRRLAKSQLQGLRDAFERDPATAELTLLYQISRTPELRQLLLDPADQTNHLARVTIPPLWWRPPQGSKASSTAISDLIDIARTVLV